MRACLIFNPEAGSASRIKNFLLHLTGDHRCELRATSLEVGPKQIAREAVSEGFSRIIVAGGDGTVSNVVNGIAPDFDAVELAVLPFGTGNDLARILGLLPEQLDNACVSVFGDRLQTIDLIRITGDGPTSYCINVANGGMGGLVAADIHSEDKRRWGPVAYWMNSVSKLITAQPIRVELTMDDRRLNIETLGLAVANGRYVGGGFPIAPRALLNDGLLDVTILPVLPMLELMSAGLNFSLGAEHRDDRVQHFTAKKIKIHATPQMPFSIDGEASRRGDVEFEVIPAAMRVVVSEGADGFV